MKILIIQHKGLINGIGGTEKICVFLANCFTLNNFQVDVATNDENDGKPFFELNSNIEFFNIYDKDLTQINELQIYNYKGKNPVKWMYYKWQKKKDKFLNKKLLKKHGGKEAIFFKNLEARSIQWFKFISSNNPDIIITMSISTLLEISYKNNYKVPIINSTNGRPDYDYFDKLWYRSPFEMEALINAYKSLSGIQVLFEDYKKYLPKSFEGIAKTIGNPVPDVENQQLVNHLAKKNKYKILHIGTLNISCKQQDSAIKIFSKIAHKYPDWTLEFWGIGKDYRLLKKIIDEKKLKSQILLKGYTRTPLDELIHGDIFIFPSKYEGFGLALAEAMSIGLPVLGFENCSGVNELIKNGENGFLCKDEHDMTKNLEILINNPKKRSELGYNAHLSMKQFSPENISKQWLSFVNEFKS